VEIVPNRFDGLYPTSHQASPHGQTTRFPAHQASVDMPPSGIGIRIGTSLSAPFLPYAASKPVPTQLIRLTHQGHRMSERTYVTTFMYTA
jgi:hypothetical protein